MPKGDLRCDADLNEIKTMDEKRVREGVFLCEQRLREVRRNLKTLHDARVLLISNGCRDERKILRPNQETTIMESRREQKLERFLGAYKERLNVLTSPGLAQKLKRLRRECGWSLNDLADKTGLDKKLIIGHENGKGIQPKTLKLYADAFTRELKRKVLVSELEN